MKGVGTDEKLATNRPASFSSSYCRLWGKEGRCEEWGNEDGKGKNIIIIDILRYEEDGIGREEEEN